MVGTGNGLVGALFCIMTFSGIMFIIAVHLNRTFEFSIWRFLLWTALIYNTLHCIDNGAVSLPGRTIII